MRDRNLFVQAITKFPAGLVLVGLLLFLPAGTFDYWQARLLIVILFVPMFIAGIILMKINPELLRKRLNAKEEPDEQKTVAALSGLLFIAAFVVAGFSQRFGWMIMPAWISRAAAVIFLLAYVLYGEVLRENNYSSRTVKVQENQKVIDNRLYGAVCHPMYMSTLFLFLSMPLVPGSLPSFVIMLGYIPIIAKRIRNEEKVLENGLEGYKDYKKKVRWKVIPYFW